MTLASGHGRYMLHSRYMNIHMYTRTDTFVRVRWGVAVTYIYNRYRPVTILLPKR
jgi:hypothetical protein